MEEQKKQAGITKRTKQVFIYALAALIFLGYLVLSFTTIYLVFTGKIEDISQNIVLLIGGLFGTWQALVMLVASYFYGTSQSSAEMFGRASTTLVTSALSCLVVLRSSPVVRSLMKTACPKFVNQTRPS